MLTIALTGGIACGKSTLAQMFQARGARVIDADEISRALTAPNGLALPAIRRQFGEGVFHPDGTLDRAALAAVVFGEEAQLAALNAITHPLIEREMRRQMDESRKMGAQIVVLDVPLLFEAGMQHLGDVTLCAYVPEETQIQRLFTRNGLSRAEALSRIRSQMPAQEKARRCDVVINTARTLAEVEQTAAWLYEGWLAAARKENA